MREVPKRSYQFADCVLDPTRQTLLRDGASVEVQNQVFDLLHFLLRHPDKVISKDRLLAEVWHNQHLTDATIAQAVRKARLAVGDDGHRQAVIQTVHGRGIRLIVPVRVADAGPPADASVSGDPAALSASRGTRTLTTAQWSAGLLILLLAVAAILVLWQWQKPAAGPALAVPSVAVLPFENATGDPEYQWLQFGLAKTVGLLLQESGVVRAVGPEVTADLPEGDLADRTAVLGTDFGMAARIHRSAGRFEVQWHLSQRTAQPVTGQFSTADASSIARQLVEVAVAHAAGTPKAPVPAQPVLDDPLALELYSRGIEAQYADDRAQAATLLAAALAREPGSHVLAVALAVARFDPRDAKNSLVRYRKLRKALPPDARSARTQLAYEIGNRLWYEGEVKLAEPLLRQALQSSREDPLLRARILNSLAFVCQSRLKHEQAWEYAKQSEMILRELDDPYDLSMAMTNLGYLAEDMGRLLEAGNYHRQALEIRLRYRFPSLVAASRYGLARINRRRGDFAAADALLQQSLAEVVRLKLPYDHFDNLEELAELRMHQGRFDDAAAALKQADALAHESGDEIGQAWAQQVRVRLKLRRGNADAEAFALIDKARETFEKLGENQDAIGARVERAQLLMLADRTVEARAVIDQIVAGSPPGNPVLALRVRRVQARLAARDEPHAAIAAWQDIVRDARAIGALDLEAESAIDLGHLALARSQPALAKRMLAIARSWSPDYYRCTELAQAIQSRA